MRNILIVLSLATFLSGAGCILVDESHEDDELTAWCDADGCWYCDAWGCYEYGCDLDSDCPDNCSCLTGQCFGNEFREPGTVEPPAPSAPAPEPAGKACVTDQQCDTGQACDERGLCVSNEGRGERRTPPESVDRRPGSEEDIECRASCQCPDGQVCEVGRCVDPAPASPDAPVAACAVDCDCPAGDACVAGQCARICASAADCVEGQACADGACADAAAVTPLLPGVGDGCLFDHQCDPASRCLDGACYLRCADNAQCPPGEACLGGEVCVPDPGAAPVCVYSADCGADAFCVDGACISTCASDEACGPGCTCETGLCQPDRLPSPQCLRTADCADGGEGLVCVDAVCRTRCGTSSECGDGATCENGFCFGNRELSPECLDADDCSDGGRCLDAACVTLD